MSNKFNIKYLLLAVPFLLTACGPKMQNVTDYTPPTTDSGMQCVATANQARANCDSDNRISLEQCSIRAAEEADHAFMEANTNYTHALERYISSNEHYEHAYAHFEEQKELIIKAGELEYIQCSDDVKMNKIDDNPHCKHFLKKSKKKAHKLDSPRAPVKPYPPNRNAIFNRFKANCNKHLKNCEQNFNQNYRSCGGSVDIRQVCVSNC